MNDFQNLLTAVSQDSVSGENCEYDDVYLSLDTYALGTPEDEMGDSVIEGKDPDYRELYSACLKLWEKTRDLRVACYFTLSSVCLFGLEGLRDGLKLIDYLVKEQFDSFYPQLDPDDDNDPTERINVLAMLSPVEGAYSDPYRFLAHTRDFKLVKELDYTLRDYLVVSGYLESSDNRDLSSLNAQLCSVPATSIQERLSVLDEVLSLVDGICDSFNEKIGNSGFLTLDSLKHELQLMRGMYANAIKNSSSVAVSSEEEVHNTAQVSVSSPASAAVSVPASASVVNIDSYVPKNRNDAVALLKKGAEYFNLNSRHPSLQQG
ncbi:MAG: ImpA family type VI secretion system protein [Succinivibrio sp.]